MFPYPFVVLDLETSGIDPKKDDIIEAALIRYEKGQEVARYQALIKRTQPLSDIITIITGITDSLLQQEGQKKEDVLKKITELTDGAYLVGHNIGFDIGFLDSSHTPMNLLGALDTVLLTHILYPDMASYSLESLSDFFGIKHKESHRAMADTQATLELFKLLWQKAASLPASLLKEMNDLLRRTEWKGALFFDSITTYPTDKEASCQTQSGDSSEKMSEIFTGIPRPLSMTDIFGDEGLLKQNMNDYESRPQQMEMAAAVAAAFEHSYHLICEAPTGVGKSMAYLSAAAELALSNQTKVVISTNTINLQQQLYEKEVPFLRNLYLKATGHPGVRVALLKGRSHYLCLRRLAEFKSRERFIQEEIVLLLKVMVWQCLFSETDMTEMNLTREEQLIWDFELCADQKYCTPQKCQSYGICDLQKARKNAEKADLVIVNHALLCADLEAEGSLLPEYHYLVVDEAHHFEEVATRSFGTEIKQAHFAIPIKNISSQLQYTKQNFGTTLFVSQNSFQELPRLIEDAGHLHEAIHRFFDLLTLFIGRNVPQSGFVENLLIDQVILGIEEWMNVGSSFAEISGDIKNWLQSIKRLIQSMQNLGEEFLGKHNTLIDELSQEINILSEILGFLERFFNDDIHSELIRWMTSDMKGLVTIHAAPVMVGPSLQKRLYDSKKAVVFTSATLGVALNDEFTEAAEQEPFAYFKKMMGIEGEKFVELLLNSPFDFETQTYVITPDDLFMLQARNSPPQIAHFFEDMIEVLEGSMMGLFTSHGALQNVYMHTSQSARNQKSRILGQRLSGGRAKILKAYMNDPAHSILLGVNSFWEGVDIQREALTTLIIHKLPFDVPSDPIIKVRSQMFHNGFMEYCVPRAILRFRQGFGRLIRSKKDYGVMVILDNRVIEKDYGKMFLKALPDSVTIEKMPHKMVPAKVKEWLEWMKKDFGISTDF